MPTPADVTARRTWRRLASRIYRLYSNASDEIADKAKAALDAYVLDPDDMRGQYARHEITRHALDAWVHDTLDKSERLNELQEAVVSLVLQCDHVATDWIAGALPTVWRGDMLYSTYLIEALTRGGVSFTLLDDQAIQRLIMRTPHLLPVVDDAKNSAYVRGRFRHELTQGIIQGEDVPSIARRLQTVSNADRAAATRQARTSITSARNGARQEVAERAVDMGIDIKKRWLATLDDRTRDTHQHLDGETVTVDAKFSNGLMFPGDPEGKPGELYNCRCTMTYVDERTGKPQRRDGMTGDVIDWITYDDWVKQRKAGASP
jgi:SPP1 gp7 family putative phage head morphogenesis protein